MSTVTLTYKDNKSNRELGRVGQTYQREMAPGKTLVYKDTEANRKLGRVGQTYISKLSQFQPGVGGPGRRSPLDSAAAQKAFDKFYGPRGNWRKYRAMKQGKPATIGQARAARAQDLLRSMSPKRTVSDGRFKSRPDLYDYAGIDTGPMQPHEFPAGMARKLFVKGQRSPARSPRSGRVSSPSRALKVYKSEAAVAARALAYASPKAAAARAKAKAARAAKPKAPRKRSPKKQVGIEVTPTRGDEEIRIYTEAMGQGYRNL